MHPMPRTMPPYWRWANEKLIFRKGTAWSIKSIFLTDFHRTALEAVFLGSYFILFCSLTFSDFNDLNTTQHHSSYQDRDRLSNINNVSFKS